MCKFYHVKTLQLSPVGSNFLKVIPYNLEQENRALKVLKKTS